MGALHITNGDCAASPLRTFLAEPVVIAADPLFDGPAPDVPDEAWYRLRGGRLDASAAGRRAGAPSIADQLAASDRALAHALEDRREIVLWFEHDLFDQLLLIRTLDRTRPAAAQTAPPSVFLICIDRFPGVERFVGLGQLTAAQLETLLPAKRRVGEPVFAAASRAWSAFRSARPDALLPLGGTGELPFLGAALRRFLEEYPSTFNGTSRSEMQVLRVLADGPAEAGALFAATQQFEEVPFMGDWSLFAAVANLARQRVPLLTVTPDRAPHDLRGCAVALTEAGREVLAGRQDAVALNGIDVWRGGVHLTGAAQSPWRWDAPRQTLVSLEA